MRGEQVHLEHYYLPVVALEEVNQILVRAELDTELQEEMVSRVAEEEAVLKGGKLVEQDRSMAVVAEGLDNIVLPMLDMGAKEELMEAKAAMVEI